MAGYVNLGETATVDQQTGAIENLQTDHEFVTSYRAVDVADSTEVMDVVVQNPGSSIEDVLLVPTFTTGGLAYIETGFDVSIGSAGTELEILSKHVGSGSTSAVTAEQGGTYTTNGTTLESVLPGQARGGGPSTNGADSPAIGAILLNPGEAIRYTVTNQSGGSASFSVSFSIVEVRN